MGEGAGPVMVATDLSARDDRAVDRALLLGASWGKRVNVVHVTRPALETDAADVRAVLPDPHADVDILLPVGSAPETIVRTARGLEASIIVTGVARFNHLGDYFLGTAVDHVIRHAPAPVLVVKQRAHRPYARLLIAVDLSPPSRAALLMAAALFPEAELHVIRAYHVPYKSWIDSPRVRDDVRNEAQAEMDAFLSELPLAEGVRKRVTVDLGEGGPDEVIARAIKAVEPDLVVIGSHGVSGFVQATMGSTAASLLSWIRQDVLVVRAPEKAL